MQLNIIDFHHFFSISGKNSLSNLLIQYSIRMMIISFCCCCCDSLLIYYTQRSRRQKNFSFSRFKKTKEKSRVLVKYSYRIINSRDTNQNDCSFKRTTT